MITDFNTKHFVAIIMAITLFSCVGNQNNESVETINIGEADVISYQLDDLNMLPLETKDSTLIRTFGGAFVYDGKVYVISNLDMFCFNATDGRFNFKIEKDLSNIFENEHKIFAYNNNNREMSLYTEDGEYLSTINALSNDSTIFPTLIIPLDTKKYLIRNSYRGQQNTTPEFGVLNEDFQFDRNLKGLYVNDGFFRDDIVKSKDNYALYSPNLTDSIFIINKDGVSLKYIVNFNAPPLPKKVKDNGLVFAIDWINKNMKNSFSGMITSCYDNGENVFFMSLVESELSIISYNKANKRTQVNKILCDKSKFMPQIFLAFNDDNAYLFVFDKTDSQKNPYLVKLDFKSLI